MLARKRAAAWIVLPAAFAGSLQAQVLPPLDEYHIRAFEVEDGLLNSDVSQIAQTRDGFLYVASGRGLARFDGHEFRRVPLPGLQSLFLQRIHRDSRDRLWVLSTRNELGYLERGQFHLLPSPPARIGVLTEAAGALWAGSDEGLIRIEDDAAAPFVRVEVPHVEPGGGVGLYELPGHELVLLSRHVLMRAERDSTRASGFRFEPIPLPPALRDPAVDFRFTRVDERGMWVATPRGVFAYRSGVFERVGSESGIAIPVDSLGWRRMVAPTEIGETYHLPMRVAAGVPDERVRHPVIGGMRTADGTLWLILADPGRGPHSLHRVRQDRLERVQLREHLSFRSIRHIIEDHEGSLWVGTDGGLIQLAPDRAYALTDRHGLAEVFTVPVLQARDGSVWVGTWGGGLHRFADGALAERWSLANGLPDDHVRSLYESRDGTLWAGLNGHVVTFRNGRQSRELSNVGEVRAFAETADGRLWIGGDHRLHVRTATGIELHQPDFWQGKRIWTVHPHHTGGIWVGTDGGLFHVSGDLRTIEEVAELRGRLVVATHAEPDGTLWFSTYASGLYRYRAGRFAVLTSEHGLLHEGVWRLLPDGAGGIWMSGDFGISRVEHDRLHAVADAVERGEPPPFRLAPLVFTEAEGMPSRESNRGFPAGWRLRDGRLLFNNIAGLVVIDPERALAPRPPPNVAIQGVYVDGDTLPSLADAPPKLDPRSRHVAFEFVALSFLAPEQNRYRYRLDGYDPAWIDAARQRRAAYTNLAPGRYVFRAQAASGPSDWSADAAVYAFVVPPLAWETWWFRLSGVLVIAAGLLLLHRYRLARALELDRLRLRIAADLHDDVGSNLSSIALLSEMLSTTAQPGDELQQRQVARIHLAAEETIGRLRDVIWLVDPRHGTLQDLVDRMNATASELLNGRWFEMDAPAVLEPRPLGMTFMRNAFLIYKEALHNVAKHAGACSVRTVVRVERDVLTIGIEDDGTGFDERQAGRGYGLASMRARAEQVRGTLLVEKRTEGGTRVEFRAPMA